MSLLTNLVRAVDYGSGVVRTLFHLTGTSQSANYQIDAEDALLNTASIILIDNAGDIVSPAVTNFNEIVTEIGNRGFTLTKVTSTDVNSAPLPSNANRRYLLVQNNDTANDLFVNFGSAAVANASFKIPFGGVWEWNAVCPNSSVNLICSTGLSITNVILIEG